MTLQTAKQKIKKAIRAKKFTEKENLPCGNYVLNAYNECQGSLSYQQSIKFENWFDSLDY